MRRARIEPFEFAVGLGAALLLAWALFVMAGCDKFYMISAASLTTAERAVITAAETLPTASAARQAQALAGAVNRADVDREYKVIRAQADVAAASIEAAHKSIKFARDSLVDVKNGLANKSDVSKWVAAAVRAYRNLSEILRVFSIDLPGGL